MHINWNAPLTGWHFLGFILLVVTGFGVQGAIWDYRTKDEPPKPNLPFQMEDDYLLGIGIVWLLVTGLFYAYYDLALWLAIPAGVFAILLAFGCLALCYKAVHSATTVALRHFR